MAEAQRKRKLQQPEGRPQQPILLDQLRLSAAEDQSKAAKITRFIG